MWGGCDRGAGGTLAKEHFLQIRLSEDERERINSIAETQHLRPSTWARSVVLKAVEAAEARLARGRKGLSRRPPT